MFQDGSGGTRLLLSALGLGVDRNRAEMTGHDRAGLFGDAALAEEPKPQDSLTKNAPCNRHPVGRGVLLGPPLADLGAANAVLRQLEQRQIRRSLAAEGMQPSAGSGGSFDLRGPTRLTP